MWLVLGVIGTVLVIAIKELPPLWAKRQTKEVLLLILLSLSVSVLGVTMSLHKKMPNPMDWIAAAIYPFARALYSLFA